MLLDTLTELFKRDLNKLITEIDSYKHENNLWITNKDISNSAGNLCLHIVGNLNTYIGAELGNTGYIRQRDLEFSLKHISRQELIQQVNDTMVMIENTLNKLSLDDLKKEYPLLVLKEKTSIEYFLVHLVDHLSYHLGQINYHRRLLD